MLGRDANDPLFLQLKEAQASVLEPFLGKSAFAKHGQRVVEGQRLMQAASDIMLGWMRITTLDGVSRDFYVRQLWDGKGSALVEMMNPAAMTAYARVLRPGTRQGARPLRGRDRDRELSRRGRQVRPCAGFVRGGLRRPERTRLRRPAGRRRHRPRCRRNRALTRGWVARLAGLGEPRRLVAGRSSSTQSRDRGSTTITSSTSCPRDHFAVASTPSAARSTPASSPSITWWCGWPIRAATQSVSSPTRRPTPPPR